MGKSTVVQSVLQVIGLKPEIPVTSPTFTYLNEYCIDKRWYAHFDLYRCDKYFEFRDLGFEVEHPCHGVFVEWPGRGNSGRFLRPTHHIWIDRGDEGGDHGSPTLRTLRFESAQTI